MARIKRRYGGPFLGYKSSVPRDMVGPQHLTGDYNGDSIYSYGFRINPRSGRIYRRGGAAIFSANSGCLETVVADASARCLQILSMASPSMSDGYPVPVSLFADETKGFAWVYMRSSNGGGADLNLGDDFSTAWSYPITVGARQALSETTWKVMPIPYFNNGIGLTRGAYEATRRYFGVGSRSMELMGDYLILPGLKGVPIRWDRRINDASGAGTEETHIVPLGGTPPLWVGKCITADLPAATTATRAWKEGDQFYYSLLYEYDDGSWGMPYRPSTTPLAAPGAEFMNAYGLVTVPSTTASTDYYDYIPLKSIAAPPKGVKRQILCRSPKVDSSVSGAAPNPFDLRVTAILPPTAVTSYRDYNGSDGALVSDPRIRLDHQLPYPARHAFTFDGRLALSYLDPPNPICLYLAPSGVAASLDNYAYNDQSALGNNYALMRIISGTFQLRYCTASPGAPGTASISIGSTVTLRQLIDSINATLYSDTANEWRAQLAPGADENATTDNLALTYLELTCTASSGSATMTTLGSYTNAAVGMRVRHANVPAGTYVKSIESTNSLTLSAVTTGAIAAATVGFNVDTGDDAIVNDSTYGNVQCFLNALPGLATWNRAYCEKFQKQVRDIEFTAGGPGDAPYAADRFMVGNRRSASGRAGISMGGSPLLNGGITWYSNAIGRIANIRGGKTGDDKDYRNEVWTWDDGCISPYSVVNGNGWAGALTRQGYVVTDGVRRVIITGDIHDPTSGAGDLAAEIASCEKAANTDGTDYGFFAHVQSGVLWIAFRRSGSGSYCDCVMSYDFSPSLEGVGLAQVLRPDGQPYGWSSHLEYNWRGVSSGARAGAIGSVRKSDGLYLLTADDSNDKTTCGLIARFENGTYTENGTAVPAIGYGATDTCDTTDKKMLVRGAIKRKNAGGATASALAYGNIARTITGITFATAATSLFDIGRAWASSSGRSLLEVVEPAFLVTGAAGAVEYEFMELELDTFESRV